MARPKKSEAVRKAEEAIKEAKAPKIVEKLALGGGEIYVGKLSNEDKFQLLIRHVQIIENALNMIAQCGSITAICNEELCKKQGIDIAKIINKK